MTTLIVKRNRIDDKALRELCKAVKRNARYKNHFHNVNVICKYFYKDQNMMKFYKLRKCFLSLHKIASSTPSATIYENPEIGYKRVRICRKWDRYVSLMFTWILMACGAEQSTKLQAAFFYHE